MDMRWTLQVVFLAFLASCGAQSFQPGGFQPQTTSGGGFQPQTTSGGGFQPQRVVPQSLTEEQQEAIRVQNAYRKSVADANQAGIFKPTRPPSLEQPIFRTAPQQPTQAQSSGVASQGFQSFPQQSTQTRTQAPVRQRPAVRLQQPRQPVRPQPQSFDLPQAPTQQFEQQQVSRPQQQFDQPTAQKVNQLYFDQHLQQNVEQPPEPPVVRRPAPVVRSQNQQTQHTQQPQQSQFDPELFQQQAENARYSFSSSVSDSINDQEHVREETRDGLNLKGLYSYSDGFFKRTVHYEADQNGYRVIKEEVDAIGDGPVGDPNGRADVSAQVEGNNLKYSITAADIPARAIHSPVQQPEQRPFTFT